MNIRIIVRSMIVACAALIAWGCSGRPVYTYRYKLTIEVETPDGPKRAANVVEVSETTVTFPDSAYRRSIRGEALYLDLGPSRPPLLALLNKYYFKGVNFDLYGPREILSAYSGSY